MAKLIAEFAPTLTGKVIGDFTWDFCKKVSDASDVSAAGSTLAELGNGLYVISNPNITEDTAFRVHLTTDVTKYTTGLFSMSDGNIALQTTVTSIPTTPLLATNYTAPDNASITLIKTKTDNLPASPAAVGSAMTLAAADVSGNLPVDVKVITAGVDLSATMKASVTSAVPTAATIGTDTASKVLVTPAQKIVTDSSGYVSANVKSQDNIDFGALQKASLDAATPAVTVSDKTGYSLSTAGILAIWNQLTADVGIVASSFGKKLKDWVLGTDNKMLISTDVQDLHTTLTVGSTVSSVTGAYTITARAVLTGTTTPIPGVWVSLYNSDESVCLETKQTSAAGYAVFSRDAGTYKIRQMLAGYSFTTVTAVVTTTDVTATLSGTAYVIPTAPSDTQQTLYGYVKEFGGSAFSAGDTITMVLNGTSQYSTAGTVLEKVTRTTTVGADGSWVLYPDKGAKITITISNAAGVYYSHSFRVTGDASKTEHTYS